jgi:anhydro-N-acetylmuramic acid kinase
VVNVGGVANVTYVGAVTHDREEEELVAFDTGPGNALINDWVRSHGAGDMDTDGKLAAQGRVKESVLADLLSNPYFSQEPPKSLDRNHFSLDPLGNLSLSWGAMTLTSFTALAVSRADFFFSSPPKLWIICGGGARNDTMMSEFRKRLAGRVVTAGELGWASDYLEAEAFAYLAVRSMKGLPLTFPTTTNVRYPITGGVLHKPQC